MRALPGCSGPRVAGWRSILAAVTLIAVLAITGLSASSDGGAEASPLQAEAAAASKASKARISLSPTSGRAGSSLSVSGRGFPRHGAGELAWGDEAACMPTVQADRRGLFTVSVVVPDVAPGVYPVSVVVKGVRASASYTVSEPAAPAARATPVPAGTRVRPASPIGLGDDPPPNAAPTPTPVAPDGRLTFAYYYYWYDATTGAHLQNETLRHHPPANPPATWRSVAWHKKELADMAYAGVDVVLPVYWGFDRPGDAWSWQALPILAQAWQELKTEGKNPPRIGMFFDTAIVGMRNLTTQSGRSWFYANFRDFFSRIPREQWALVNGRPVAYLFTSDWTRAVNQSTFDYVYNRFQADFGVRPYVVREVSWDYTILRWQDGQRLRDWGRPIRTENSYLWAAAMHGYVDRGGVAAVGPGYDDRHLPDRCGGTRVDREGGAFYRRHFQAAIASGKPLLAIETWNELHEGSGVSETIEFGRQYLDLTRELAGGFHAAGR